ncbi:unnamed protein product [Orchesella dallaii]|uniref:Uncharacterized protein n=1 Tax=Orchesella dallaii TaxID=48710 RepID=A0ABP1PS30_9HEXA
MGDVVYPAIQLCRAHADITHAEVLAAIHHVIGTVQANALDKYGVAPEKRHCLILFIKGMTPVFQDVNEYRHSGYAAAVKEYRTTKDDLAREAKQLGTVLHTEYLESDEDGIHFYTTTIETRHNTQWNEDKQADIGFVTLIPLVNLYL